MQSTIETKVALIENEVSHVKLSQDEMKVLINSMASEIQEINNFYRSLKAITDFIFKLPTLAGIIFFVVWAAIGFNTNNISKVIIPTQQKIEKNVANKIITKKTRIKD